MNSLTVAKVGDDVEYEVGKPTDDGKPTIKRLVVKLQCGPVEAFVDDEKPVFRAHDFRDDIDLRRMKLRLDCLRLAVDSGATIGIIDKAKEYEKFVRE
jgi:hypothetical protein